MRQFPRLGLTAVTAAVLIGTNSARAGQASFPPLPVYVCSRVAEAPVIDGRARDACWALAPVATGFLRCFVGAPFPVKPQTAFRVVHDRRHLYLFVECAEAAMTHAVMNLTGRDAPVWQDDDVELFVSSDPDARVYCQYAVTPRGTLFDAKDKKAQWNGTIALAVHRDRASWSVEARIPLGDIGLTEPEAALLRFNLMRMRRAGGGGEPSGWSPARRGFNEPARFGYLLLGGTRAHLKRALARHQQVVGTLRGQVALLLKDHVAVRARFADRLGRLDRRWQALCDRVVRDTKPIAPAEWRTVYQDLRDCVHTLRALHVDVQFEILLQ